MYSDPCYAYNANYTALDQPSSFTLGNGLTQTYGYTALMKRLSSIQVVGSAGTIFNRGYDYDNVGNVWHITGSPTFGTQTFTYDQRDRLTRWQATGIDESYTYDLLGNFISKAGIGYSYVYNNQNYGHPAGAGGPYAVRNGGYTYDANGNTLTEQIFSDQRAFTWNTENQPTQISFQGTTETYTYDADNSRIKKVRGNVTTYYIGSMYEEEVALGGGDVPEAPDVTTTRSMYMFNGQVVAQRSLNATNTLIYLHSDHLGSVGAATTSAGASLSSQEYDPWGRVRTGGVTQTKYNYTGQKLDDTGLLFYNARYYNPLVGRFTSPDSIVPGAANSKLTVDFHEGELLTSTIMENVLTLQKGFWFQMNTQDQGKADPSGPPNPQTLSRYGYALNNPVRHTDPTGHTMYMSHQEAQYTVNFLRGFAKAIRDYSNGIGIIEDIISVLQELVNRLPPAVRDLINNVLEKLAGIGLAALLGGGRGIAAYAFAQLAALQVADSLDTFATIIDSHNGGYGVAIAYLDACIDYQCGYFRVAVMNRATGKSQMWDAPWWLEFGLSRDTRWHLGSAYGDPNWNRIPSCFTNPRYHFAEDRRIWQW